MPSTSQVPAWCRAMTSLSDSNADWREDDLPAHLGRHDWFQIQVHGTQA